MNLKFTIQTKIQKPLEVVFQAVYDPKQLSSYFTTGGASGPLKSKTEVIWKFADFPSEEGVRIFVKEVEMNSKIILEWDAHEGGYESQNDLLTTGGYKTLIEISFESLDSSNTLVKITESGWRESQAALDGSYMNCQGWMNMSCCLKAYLEYGINLRKGFF
ncbi:SRPBCC family protein [Leptospira noguchii]|uniref:SRPBCC family protein n=1 Tax=Leptospira noguchii TaxID=28182 RepID=UPI001F06D681|nr:SRPBCC family protein [Leptospira noguchii]MCH1912248.1 SRPBCC family protein [Leptospira noguchii]MCH1915928.1 SRPBCC family protein [Leptospira noguchii]UOG63351.1 SRPBCC family protein [Leptospira noguchii]